MNPGTCQAVLVLVTVSCFAGIGNAQQQGSLNQGTTFTAPDGAFSFSYPKQFCKQAANRPCAESYIPVCDADAIVCVVYSPEEFKGTSFNAAAFEVKEITRMEEMTPDVCVTPYPQKSSIGTSEWPEFVVSAEHSSEMINGVRFLHGIRGEGGLSHGLSTDLYRAFHKRRCFELAIKQTGTEPHVSDPPLKTLTAAQRKQLARTMSQVLHSFRFLK